MIVLVSDAHYRMTPALVRSLGRAGYQVMTCEEESRRALPGAVSKYAAGHTPLPNTDGLVALCERLAAQNGGKIIFLPAGAKTLRFVSENRAAFEPFCHLLLADPAVLELANDKERMGQIARRIGVPAPAVFEPGEERLPCVVKPTCGEAFSLKAEQRYRIVRTPEELNAARALFLPYGGEPVVQEYIEGYGAGVSLVMDQDSEPVAVICHRRVREYPLSGGPSTCCESMYDEALVDYAVKLLQEIRFVGVAMVEFKGSAETGFRFLEINPRIWGTFPLTFAAGSDFSERWARAAMGEKLDFAANFKRGVRMSFRLSDAVCGLAALKKGRLGLTARVLLDGLNPTVRDGVFSLRDPRPGLAYLKAMFHRK